MAGLAKTDKFLISDATIMVGPMANLKTLNPAEHSIGLTKNLAVSIETTKTELTQGLQNDPVMSLVTGSTIQCTAEVYEFTSKNLSYGLGLDGASIVTQTVMDVLSDPVIAADVSVNIVGDKTADYTVGKWIFIQEGQDDYIHIGKISASVFATGETTITFTGFPVPTGMAFSSTAGRVGLINKIDADPTLGNKNFAVKVTGVMPGDKKPITLFMPKVKITKGFSLSFTSQNFSNLPFEFSPYVPVPTDPGYSLDFNQKMHIFTA